MSWFSSLPVSLSIVSRALSDFLLAYKICIKVFSICNWCASVVLPLRGLVNVSCLWKVRSISAGSNDCSNFCYLKGCLKKIKNLLIRLEEMFFVLFRARSLMFRLNPSSLAVSVTSSSVAPDSLKRKKWSWRRRNRNSLYSLRRLMRSGILLSKMCVWFVDNYII